MARLPRIVLPGVAHHVTQRGNRRLPVFFSDDDRRRYLALLAAAAEASGTRCLAWCLMDNHVHLVLVPGREDGLRAMLGEAHRRYSREINFREGWRGHLFQARFASYPMDDAHLMAAVRYVELNPVAAKMVRRAGDWRWSSAGSHLAGKRTKDDPLTDVGALGRHVRNWRAMLRHGLEAARERLPQGRPRADGIAAQAGRPQMNDMSDERLDEYYREAETWSHDRQRAADRSLRLAWIAAGVAALIAVVEAFALVALIPLKREVPYTLMVDRQTGYVQALRPLEAESVSADAALTRSFLVQYVIARESFDIGSLQENYRKVGLWSAGEARDRYISGMAASNPQSPLASLPRRATIDVAVRGVSSLSANTALVRFSTTRTDPGGRPQLAQHWQAIVTWRYSNADMTAEDRLTNPLGFQVTRYRRDAETLAQEAVQGLPEAEPIPSTVDPDTGLGVEQ